MTTGGEMDKQNTTERRKSEHIDICLNQDVEGRNITNGFEKYRFRHQALPEIDFNGIGLDTVFLGKRLKAPFLVSSMTGGTWRAVDINRRLATIAQRKGWAMGVGSVRAAVENEELAETFNIRAYAPDIVVFSNIGAVQLNYGFGPDHCRKAVEMVEANALVLHLNALQEVFQPEGNTNFSGLLRRIEQVCRTMPVPVGIKEVGWGISSDAARSLLDAGVQFIDVAGAGGTSWSQVEKLRSADSLKRAAAEAFAGWGIPTADCITDIRNELPDCNLIASGGINNGLEAAKAIALGADLAGFGRSLLAAAVDDENRLAELFERIGLELKIAMFGIGVSSIQQLKETSRLEKRES